MLKPSPPTGLTPSEVLAFRERFPLVRDCVYLVNNSMGAISDVFLQAHQEYISERLQHGATWHLAMPRHEALRGAIAQLIGAKTSEIALCYSATQALGVLSSCFDWKDRSGIVFDDYSFPSTTYLWHAQERRGAHVRRVAPDEFGLIEPEYFDPYLDKSVKIVAVAHVCYKNGHRLNLPAVAKRVHDVGALFVVDDYQCCGSRRIDVRADGIDVLVSGTVKYMLGSPGISFMFVREELLDQLHPTITGWFGQTNPDDFQVTRHNEAPDAQRFQIGTPAFSAIYDSLAGIQLISSIGLEKIERWIDSLTALLMKRLHAEGFVPSTPDDPAKRGPQVSIRANDAEAAVAALAKRGILCSSRDGNVRTAWGYYNIPADVDALIRGLKALNKLMVRVEQV